jgi:hypothetical protein
MLLNFPFSVALLFLFLVFPLASACIPSPHNPYYSFPEFRTRSQVVYERHHECRNFDAQWGSLDQNHVHPDGDPFLHRSRRGQLFPH